MWLEWTILVFCVYFYLVVFNHAKLKKLDSDVEVKYAKNSIRTIGYATLTKIVIWMGTIDRLVPNYEWSLMQSKIYGMTHVIKFPFRRSVIINSIDFELSKRIMASGAWYNRLYDDNYIFTMSFGRAIGLLFSNGDSWKQARRLSLKLLHQLDFFKADRMENFITFEIREIRKNLGRKVDRALGLLYYSPHQMFEVATLNVVLQVLMEKRYAHDDPNVMGILQQINSSNREFSPGYTVMEVFPFLKNFPRLTFLKSAQKVSQMFYDMFQLQYMVDNGHNMSFTVSRQILVHLVRIQKEIKERREKSSYLGQPTNFIDGFLSEMDKHKDNPSFVLNDEDILVILRDMVVAGADTSNSALEHGLLHVSLQPHVQHRVQAEIDEFIGKSRLPTYEDRHNMLYTQATILEILRIASPIPFTARAAVDDTHIYDNKFSRGSIFAVNIYGIHRSEEIWPDPDVFRPERFLGSDGSLINTEKIIPFGYGKRHCIGESVAKVTMFIFFTALLQKFSFQISDLHPPPSFKNLVGLSRCPVPYHVKCQRRLTSNAK